MRVAKQRSNKNAAIHVQTNHLFAREKRPKNGGERHTPSLFDYPISSTHVPHTFHSSITANLPLLLIHPRRTSMLPVASYPITKINSLFYTRLLSRQRSKIHCLPTQIPTQPHHTPDERLLVFSRHLKHEETQNIWCQGRSVAHCTTLSRENQNCSRAKGASSVKYE